MNPNITTQEEIEVCNKKLFALYKRKTELYAWMMNNMDRGNFDDVRSEYNAVSVKISTLEERIEWLRSNKPKQCIIPAFVHRSKTTFNQFQ